MIPPTLEDQAEIAEQSRSLRRIEIFAFGAYLLFALGFAVRGNLYGLLGLTCSSLVAIINFLWLKEVASTLLQSTPRARVSKLLGRSLARFGVFAVSLIIVIFVARFDSLSILLGFSIIVAGIMAEALYSAVNLFKPH